MTDFDDLSAQLAALEARLQQTSAETAAFEADLERLGRTLGWTGRELDGLARGFGAGLRRAFDGVIFDGQRLSEALRGLARALADTLYAAALRPVQGALGSALASVVSSLFQSVLPFAHGGSFAQGRVMPFAQGGIVSAPVTFPMRGGMG
jgi:phage-related minor tail protein